MPKLLSLALRIFNLYPTENDSIIQICHTSTTKYSHHHHHSVLTAVFRLNLAKPVPLQTSSSTTSRREPMTGVPSQGEFSATGNFRVSGAIGTTDWQNQTV